MTKFVCAGVEYDGKAEIMKALRGVPLLYYIELEEQAGVNLDEFDAGSLPMLKQLACWAFLLRRAAGEQLSFRQAAEEIAPDALVPSAGDDVSDEPAQAPPDPSGSGDPEPSPT